MQTECQSEKAFDSGQNTTVKQLLQNLGSGETALAEVPTPQARAGSLLIQTRCSLVSAGTERMLVEFGKANLLQKARQQPDKVKQAFDKIRTDGLLPTIEAIRSKLDQPLPLGYCNAGVVIDSAHRPLSSDFRPPSSAEGPVVPSYCSPVVTAPVVSGQYSGFQPGDRVISNGPQAAVVNVPANLCAKIPEGVSDEEAAFTVLGAIALQGLRLANPTLGERFMVFGLGLIGQLAVQLLRAHGCEVLGVDLHADRLKLAESFGARAVNAGAGADPVAAAEAWTRGTGVDGVIITASARTDEVVHQSALACRKRGRIILVGVVGLNLRRDDFYKKELSFQVSCSYGPGRYDENYEQGGQDYPLPYVRWTEQRNFEAVLAVMKSGALKVKPLITHRFKIEDAVSAYELIQKDPTALGVLQYPEAADFKATVQLSRGLVVPAPCSPTSDLRPLSSAAPSSPMVSGPAVIGLIGAGNFTGQVLLPALKKTGVRLKIIASAAGVSGTHLGRKFGFEESTTDTDSIFADPEINLVVITTRHNTHARHVVQALHAGKHVYVEKPLCLTETELAEIASVYQPSTINHQQVAPFLMVGFNRRFAPQVLEIKRLLATVHEPKALVMTFNAGALSANHWAQDPVVGGGRIIGEACHSIDLLRFLAGCPIKQVQVSAMGKTGASPCADNIVCNLVFADGSLGTTLYLANGHKSFPKERLEVFCAGRILQLNNFRKLTGFGWPGFHKLNLWRQDKGHAGEMAACVAAVRDGKPAPTPFQEIREVMQATFEAARQAAVGH